MGWAKPLRKCQETFEPGQKVLICSTDIEPQVNMKFSLQDTAFEVQFSRDPAKKAGLLKKALKPKMVPNRVVYERGILYGNLSLITNGFNH